MADTNGLYGDDPRPPPLFLEQQEQEAGLDAQFGNMLCRLMDNQLTAADAIAEMQLYTAAVVQYYRWATAAAPAQDTQ